MSKQLFNVQRAFDSGAIGDNAKVDSIDPEWADNFSAYVDLKYSEEAQGRRYAPHHLRKYRKKPPLSC